MFQKIIKVLLILFIVILIIGLIFPSLFWIWIIKSSGNNSINKLSSDLPIDHNLIRALSGLIGLGTYFTIKNLFSFNARKRNIGIVLFGLSFVTYPLLCYFIIDYNGFVFGYKRCADNLQGGYEYVDANLKIDPKYGTNVCDCTPEMILSIEGKSSPSVARIQITADTRFFTYDGKPLVWYYEHEDGKLEFFSQAGVHPQYGVSLKPVTKEIVEKTLDYINNNKLYMLVSNKANSTNQSPSNSSLINNKHSNSFKDQASNNYGSFINVTAANKSGISLAIIDENGQLSNSTSAAIAKIYSQSGKKATIGLIKNEFFKTPGFKELFAGNSEMIEKLKLAQFTTYLGLGKITYSFRNGTLVDGTIICNASITMSIISANNKSLVQSFTIKNANGNGVTASQAKEEAFQKLLNIYSTDHSSL